MRFLLFGVFISVLGLAACGDDSPTSPDTTSGNFRVMLKDSPFNDAKAVLITFTDVSAHRSGEGGFTTIGTGTRTCDLKKLQSSQDVLGVGTIPQGHYTQIRLVVSSAVIYFDNAASGSACAASIAAPAGRSSPVEIPSGEIKLNREFDVTLNSATTMVLDFDGDKSIRETGNNRFMMSPVIEVVSVQ
jgi:hypothetical protein